jgi:hypothetical protein
MIPMQTTIFLSFILYIKHAYTSNEQYERRGFVTTAIRREGTIY